MNKHLEEAVQRKVLERLNEQDKFESAVELISHVHGRGGSLLMAATAILDTCRNFVPAAQRIFEEFSEASTGYYRGKYKTLDDAFDLSRPSYWRQDTKNFELERGFEVVEMVDSLCEEGGVKPDVFYEVGERFHKDGGVIKAVYYSARNVKETMEAYQTELLGIARKHDKKRRTKLRLEGIYEIVTLLLAQEKGLDEACAAVAAAAEEDAAHIKELYEWWAKIQESGSPEIKDD